MFSRRLAVAVLLLPLAACGGATLSGGTSDPGHDAGAPPHPTPGSGTGSGGSSCTTDNDCASGQECAWSTGENWCAADDTGQGTCVTLVDLGCQLEMLETGCDCSDNNVTWPGGCSGLPSGYAPQPLAHAGACEGPSPFVPDEAGAPPLPTEDAGLPISVDAGEPPVPCSTTSDCTTGQFCGYPIGDCGTAAQCLPYAEMGLCNSLAIYCGCDGANVGLSGCAVAATVPVAHVGPCPGTDAGF